MCCFPYLIDRKWRMKHDTAGEKSAIYRQLELTLQSTTKFIQPNRMPIACRICNGVRDDIKPILPQQRTIFLFIQTRMIKGFALVSADGFSMARPAGEHQAGLRRSMAAKDREHAALVCRTKVEEAVPCQDAIKTSVERKLAHVADDPFVIRKTLLTEGDKGWRGVHAGQLVTLLDEITSNRFGRAASEIENGSLRRKESQEFIQPGFLRQRAASFPVPRMRMALV